MAVTIKDIIKCLDEIAPFAIAESWDNVGLLVGNRNREVRSILVVSSGLTCCNSKRMQRRMQFDPRVRMKNLTLMPNASSVVSA